MSGPPTCRHRHSRPDSNGWSSSQVPTCPMSSPSSPARSRRCGRTAVSHPSDVPKVQIADENEDPQPRASIEQHSEDANHDADAEVMCAEDVAAFLGVDRNTVYDYAGRGTIPCRRLGKRLLFHRPVLVSWLDPCKAASTRKA